MIPAIVICSVLVLFIGVLLLRAAMFKPKAEPSLPVTEVVVDREKAVSDLAEMIRCRTVSDRNKDLEDEAEFEKFKSMLPKLFPKVFETCEYEEVGNRAMLFRMVGKNHASPTVLMAHYDVVSVVEEKWENIVKKCYMII